MGRALEKPHFRVIAVDDGAFGRRQRYAPVVAVAVAVPGYVEGAVRGRVAVDGTDATETLLAMLSGWPHLEGARAVLVDGISLGGFNLIDLRALSRGLGRPVLSVTRRRPDFERIRSALAAYFPSDYRRRWGLVRAVPLAGLGPAGQDLLGAGVGLSRAEARRLVARTTLRGRWPEPLRLAHLIARAIGTPPVPLPAGPARPGRRAGGAAGRRRVHILPRSLSAPAGAGAVRRRAPPRRAPNRGR